jgi:putative nucleotidyltransferase with HDIG domain
MNHLSVIGGSQKDNDALRDGLSGVFDSEFLTLGDIGRSAPGPYTIVDFDLNDINHIPALKDWLRRKPSRAKVVFITDKTSPLQTSRAFAIGATDIVHRPVEPRELIAKLLGDIASLSSGPSNEAIRKSPAVTSAVGTLQSIFSSGCSGEPLSAPAMNSAGDVVVGQVETQGLTAWIDIVRTHHSQTYQHCLLVTGLAAAFGQQIGVSRTDRRRLSVAGMLHDIGKARIPLAILEKSGTLDPDELAVMKKHPEFGFDALKSMPGVSQEMLDMVVHHHEYLDGSGYPHGIGSDEISDLVRIITIADVFGALIEWRSYKPPMKAEAAYTVLIDMGAKLDQDLVRAFLPVARFGRENANRVW